MLTVEQARELKKFIKHPIQKVLLMAHENISTFQESITPIVKQVIEHSVFIDTQHQTNIEDVLNGIPLSTPVLIVFSNATVENLYMKHQIERWQAKVIIMCDQQLLHPTLNCSLYFAPIKNGKIQKHLFSQIRLLHHLLVSKNVADTIEAVPKETLKVAINRSTGPRNHFLNKKIMTSDSVMMQMLADRVQEDETFKAFLFTLVVASRDDEQMQVAAANAITGLNYAKVSFSGLDLSNIRIRHADLESANLDNVNLSGADLRDVNFQNAWLRQADLSGAKMQGVKFGEKPYFKFPKEAVAYFPYFDDDLLVVYENADGILILDAKTSNKICHLSSFLNGRHRKYISISRQKSFMAFYTKDKCIELWNIAKGEKLQSFLLPAECESLYQIALSNDGRLLIIAGTNKIQVWQTNTGKLIIELPLSAMPDKFSFDLLFFISSNDEIWNTLEAKSLHVLDQKQEKVQLGPRHLGFVVLDDVAPICGSVFSDNAQFLLTTKSGIKIWKVSSGKLLHTLELQNNSQPLCAAFSPNCEYVAIAFEKIVTLWSVETGTLMRVFEGHFHLVACVMFTVKGDQLITLDDDGLGRMWNIDYQNISYNFLNKKQVDKVLLSPNGKILAIMGWGTLSLLAVETWQVIESFEVDKYKIVSMAFSPNNKYLAVLGALTSAVTLLDVSEFPKIKTHLNKFIGDIHIKPGFDGHVNGVTVVHHKPGGRTVMGMSMDVSLTDVNALDEREAFLICGEYLYETFGKVNLYLGYRPKSVAINNTHLVVGNSDGSYHLWNLENDAEVRLTINGDRCSHIYGKAEANSSRLVMSGSLTNLQYIRRRAIATFQPYVGTPLALTLPSKVVWLGGTEEFNEGELNLLASFPVQFYDDNKENEGDVELAISHDLKLFAVTQGRVGLMFFKDSPNYIQFSPKSNQHKITCVSFSPNSEYLALGCTDRAVYLWDTNIRKFVSSVKGFGGAIINISWIRKENRLFFATSSGDNVARYWEVSRNPPDVNVVLRWSDTQFALVAEGANIYQANIANLESEKILVQNGAVTKKQVLLQTAIPIEQLLLSDPAAGENQDSNDIDVIYKENDPVLAEAQAYLEQGDKLVAKKEFLDAIKHYEWSMELSKNHLLYHRLIYCHWLQALATNDQIHFTKTEELFEQALDFFVNTHLYVLNAQYLCQKKEFKKALPYLERIFTSILMENDYQFIYNTINAVFLPKEVKEEVEEVGYLQLGAVPLAFYLIISCYLSLGQRQKAVDSLKEFTAWVDTRPNFLEYSLLGYCYKSLDQYIEAATCFMQAGEYKADYELAKSNAELCSSLANLNVALNNFQKEPSINSSAQDNNDDDGEDAELKQALAMSMQQ